MHFSITPSLLLLSIATGSLASPIARGVALGAKDLSDKRTLVEARELAPESAQKKRLLGDIVGEATGTVGSVVGGGGGGGLLGGLLGGILAKREPVTVLLSQLTPKLGLTPVVSTAESAVNTVENIAVGLVAKREPIAEFAQVQERANLIDAVVDTTGTLPAGVLPGLSPITAKVASGDKVVSGVLNALGSSLGKILAKHEPATRSA